MNFGLTNTPDSAPGRLLFTNLTTIPSSIALYLPVSPAPVVITPPGAVSGPPGTDATFTVSDTGNPTLSYQWYSVVGGVTNSCSLTARMRPVPPTPASTTSSLSIANAQPADNGGYFVVITNVFGSATSSMAQLTISAAAVPPVITGLGDQIVIAGQAVTIATTVSGSPTPTLQWQFMGNAISDGPTGNGDIISGSATSLLTISNAQYPTTQGQYSLVASNSAGVVTNSMTLTVIVPPSHLHSTSEPGGHQQPERIILGDGQRRAGSGLPMEEGRCGHFYRVEFDSHQRHPFHSQRAAGRHRDLFGHRQQRGRIHDQHGRDVDGEFHDGDHGFAAGQWRDRGGLRHAVVCYAFDRPPTLNNLGKILIYDSATATVVDTIDMSHGSPQNRTVGGVALNSYPVIVSGNTAAIYPHPGVMTFNKNYYVTIDDGVFADSTGAYFAGISSSNTWQFTTKATGPANPTNLIVAADGSGDFVTVQGAADFVPK